MLKNTYLSINTYCSIMVKLQKFGDQHTITIPKKIVELKNYEKSQEFDIKDTEKGLLLKEVDE